MLVIVNITLSVGDLPTYSTHTVWDTDHTEGHTEGDTIGTRRLDLKEAAAELGITSEAVRRRAKRGTLPSENGEDGRLYVWLPDVSDSGVHSVSNGEVHGGPHAGGADNYLLRDVLLERVEDENDFLRREVERLHQDLESRREELRRKDHLLAAALERIPPALEEASPELPEGPEKASDKPLSTSSPSEEEQQRSWWQRLFGVS